MVRWVGVRRQRRLDKQDQHADGPRGVVPTQRRMFSSKFSSDVFARAGATRGAENPEGLAPEGGPRGGAGGGGGCFRRIFVGAAASFVFTFPSGFSVFCFKPGVGFVSSMSSEDSTTAADAVATDGARPRCHCSHVLSGRWCGQKPGKSEEAKCEHGARERPTTKHFCCVAVLRHRWKRHK